MEAVRAKRPERRAGRKPPPPPAPIYRPEPEALRRTPAYALTEDHAPGLSLGGPQIVPQATAESADDRGGRDEHTQPNATSPSDSPGNIGRQPVAEVPVQALPVQRQARHEEGITPLAPPTASNLTPAVPPHDGAVQTPESSSEGDLGGEHLSDGTVLAPDTAGGAPASSAAVLPLPSTGGIAGAAGPMVESRAPERTSPTGTSPEPPAPEKTVTQAPPEPVATAAAPSPREAIAPAIGAVRQRAAGARQHSPASVPVASAQAAAIHPETEQTRGAAAGTVANLDAAETERVRRNEFKAKLKEAIDKATPQPKSESEAKKVMKTGATDASKVLRGELATESAAATGPLKAAADKNQEVPPSDLPPPPKTDLQPEPVGPSPPPVSAAPVVPAPLPPERLDYSYDRAPADQLMVENQISQEQLERGHEPEFGPTLEARQTAEEHEATVETRYRQSESQVRDQAGGRAQQALGEGLSGMHDARAVQIGQVVEQQVGTKSKNAAERQRITHEITAIKDRTRADVETILTEMETEAGEVFEAGLRRAEQAYEDTFEEAKGGIGTWLTTWGKDWERLIERSLAKARKEYLRQVDIAIDRVADLVEAKLAKAKQRVADGRKAVDTFVQGLDDSVKQYGEEALQAVRADFDAMGTEIDQRRDGLIDKLAQQYKDSYERMSAKEEELRAANKSLWQRVYDATVGLVKKILAFKDMLLGVLGKAAAVVGDIIADPIGFLRNLVSGVMQGLENFMGKIGVYLRKGLMDWLFGALAGTGLRLPEKFDLEGIVSIVLQILGLTYANFRARAVTIVGESVVAALEQAAEVFKIVITEGVAGLWRFIKEQLADLKSMVLDAIFDFIKERVIIAGITWIIGLLNPASAFFKACKAIYDIVMFFVNQGSRILALVNAVVDSIAAIAKGALGTAAGLVEGALAKAVPVAIGFLASLLGLGDPAKPVRDTIEKARSPVNKAIDWVINLAVKGVKAAGGFVKGLFGDKKKEEKPEEKPKEDDPQKEAKIEVGLAAIDTLEQQYLQDGRIKQEDAEKVAVKAKTDHPVFKSITVNDAGKRWDYHWEASPGKPKTGSEKAEQGDGKPGNYEEIIKLGLVEKPVKDFNPPPPEGYSKYKRDDKWFIRRVDADDKKYQRLGVDSEQKIVLGAGISEAEALRSEAEMRKELGPAEPGKERHHLIPLSVCASHPLVREAIKAGDPPYPPNSGLVYLPKDEEAAKKMPGLPIHSGQHPKWTARVNALLNQKQLELISAFGSMENIPKKTLAAEIRDIQNVLRDELSSWSRLE
jgi:hypothetical protein